MKMRITVYFAEKWLKKRNGRLKGDRLSSFNEKSIRAYLRKFELVFRDKATHFNQEEFQEICDLNTLFALQLKLNVDLPEKFYQVAYDFDNPEYPGFKYVSKKVKNNGYLLGVAKTNGN
jgi:hypothetical protein